VSRPSCNGSIPDAFRTPGRTGWEIPVLLPEPGFSIHDLPQETFANKTGLTGILLNLT
jgi:hypothetical protein